MKRIEYFIGNILETISSKPFIYWTFKTDSIRCPTVMCLSNEKEMAIEMIVNMLKKDYGENPLGCNFVLLKSKRLNDKSYNNFRMCKVYAVLFMVKFISFYIVCDLVGSAISLSFGVLCAVLILIGMFFTSQTTIKFIIWLMGWHTIYDSEYSTCELDAHDYYIDKGGSGEPEHFGINICPLCKKRFSI
jgi:hypothetical protein